MGINRLLSIARCISPVATALVCLHLPAEAQIIAPCPTGMPVVSEAALLGENADDNFGTGLSRAGDVNGDGWEDILVGAPYSSAGATNGGAAYLFHGGAAPSSTYAWRLLAEAPNDQLGYAVAGIGDINGDGYDDIAIGARYSDRARVDAGAVWVVYGSATNFGDNFLIVTGNTAGAAGFGHALAGGDFNGDGYADLVVGAPLDGLSPFIQRGKVQVFWGSADGLRLDNPLTLIGEASGHQFGWSVANAGDVNNDGFDDLVVGARWYGVFPNSGVGRAYIYLGGNPMNATADVVLTGEAADDWLGYAVAGAGDVNDDGFADVAVSAPLHRQGSATGRVYVLYGGNPMNNTPDLVLNGAARDDQFGWSISGGVDINADGFSDIIVGARFSDCAASNSGSAYVFFGGNPPGAVADLSVGSIFNDDALGTSVAMISAWGEQGPAAMASAVWNDLTASAAGAVSIFSLSFPRPLPVMTFIQADLEALIQLEVAAASGSVYRIEFIDALDALSGFIPFAASGFATAVADRVFFQDDFTTNSSGYYPTNNLRFYRAWLEE